MLHERFSRLAFACAMRILGDAHAAEETVQDAFLAVWCRAASYRRERGTVRGWICSIARNRAIDRLRGTEGRGRDILPLHRDLRESVVTDPWEEVVEALAAEDVRGALTVLPREQRRVIQLAYFAGYSQVEISELTRVPLGTVKSRTRLALRKLKGAVA